MGELIPLTGVRLAAERLAVTVLDAFDSHDWRMFRAPWPCWICVRCWLPMEDTAGRRCDRGVEENTGGGGFGNLNE